MSLAKLLKNNHNSTLSPNEMHSSDNSQLKSTILKEHNKPYSTTNNPEQKFNQEAENSNCIPIFESSESSQQDEPRNINSILSDDCLRLILSHFPLYQQLHLRPVCSKWNHLITNHCHGKCSLKLFSDHDHMRMFINGITNFKVADNLDDFNGSLHDLHNESLILRNEPEMVELASQIVPKLFPSIQSLVIRCPKLFHPSLMELVRSWAPTLRALLIFRMPPPGGIPPNFWCAMSSLTQLERCHFVRTYKCPVPETFGPILKNLRFFCITHYIYPIEPILINLKHCEAIKMSMLPLSVAGLEQVLEQNPQFAQNLYNLSLGTISSPPNVRRNSNFRELLQLISLRFRNLRFLDMFMADQLHLCELIPILANLTSLNEFWFYMGGHQLDPNPTRLSELPQLRSIRSLYVETYNVTVDDFCLWLKTLFPRVVHLTVKCADSRIKTEFSQQIEVKLRKELRLIDTIVHK